MANVDRVMSLARAVEMLDAMSALVTINDVELSHVENLALESLNNKVLDMYNMFRRKLEDEMRELKAKPNDCGAV